LSKNPSIKFTDVLENIDKPWNWEGLSRNPSIKFTDVLENPDKPWNWHYLSDNPSIKFTYVLENIDKPWCWEYLSYNPSIKFTDVLENIDKPWSWAYLSLNLFNGEKEDRSARIIQKGCYNWLYNAKCKDGTMGIVPRLGWNKIQELKIKRKVTY
jgi:hypothetical protein